MQCPCDKDVMCLCEDCPTLGCKLLHERAEQMKAKAEQQWHTLMTRIEKLPDAQQEKIIECGMRLRELACFYGPYFTQALMITSAEIGAGRLLMPKVANCDGASQLMMPGGKTVEQFLDTKIIVPGAKGHS